MCSSRTGVAEVIVWVWATGIVIGIILGGCVPSPLASLERDMVPLLGKNGARGSEFNKAWDNVAVAVKQLASQGYLKHVIASEYLEGKDEAQFLTGLLMLDELPPGEVLKVSEAWLKVPRPIARKDYLIKFLATNPKSELIPLLIRYVHDADISVRSSAVYGLVSVGTRAEVVPVLRESLCRGLPLWYWPIDKSNPCYLRNGGGAYAGSAATYLLLTFGDETVPMLTEALSKAENPTVRADILKVLHRTEKPAAVDWCRENLDTIQDSRTLYWAINTLTDFGSREDKKNALGAVVGLSAMHQHMIAKELLGEQDHETLFDFCLIVAETPELVSNLSEVLVGRDLFTRLIRERFQMEVDYIAGIEAFSVWYESLPREQ